MSNIQSMGGATPPPEMIFRRIALPFAIFSAVLAALLMLSWLLLVPFLTTVEVGGVQRDTRELRQYAADLTAKLAGVEQKRSGLLFPLRNSDYGSLLADKQSDSNPLTLFDQLNRVAETFTRDGQDVVSVTHFQINLAAKTAELSGDVRGVGPRSMTVLSQFVEQVESLPGVASVRHPAFVREKDDAGAFHSPFTLTLALP